MAAPFCAPIGHAIFNGDAQCLAARAARRQLGARMPPAILPSEHLESDGGADGRIPSTSITCQPAGDCTGSGSCLPARLQRLHHAGHVDRKRADLAPADVAARVARQGLVGGQRLRDNLERLAGLQAIGRGARLQASLATTIWRTCTSCACMSGQCFRNRS